MKAIWQHYDAIEKVAAVAISACVAIAMWCIPPIDHAEILYRSTTWFVLLGTFLLWLQTLLPENWNLPWRTLFRKHGPALGLAILTVVAMVLVSEPKFRVFSDEIHLAAVSFSMYHDQSILVAQDTLYVFGDQEIVSSYLGRRPLFFPFFVSIVHTLTGYRAENVFGVNAAAAGGCLFIFYLLLQTRFTRFWSCVGMLLLASFPMLVTYSTAGGFEIVNLLFVLWAFWLLHRFLVERKTRNLERLALTLVILAQIRYESPLWVLCFGLFLVFQLRPSDYGSLTYRSVILPLLFLPVLWQRRLVSDPGQFGIGGDDSLFALSRIPENLGNAWTFFSHGETRYGSVPPVFYLALLGGLYAAHRLWRHRTRIPSELSATLVLAALSCIVQATVIFAYYYGDLTQFVSSRFGIVFLPVLALLALLFVAGAIDHFRLSRNYAVVMAVGLITLYWPIAAEHHSSAYRGSFREHYTNLDYLNEHYPERDNLIIFEPPYWYLVYGWGTVSGGYANVNREVLLEDLRDHRYRNILVLQEIRYSDHQPTELSVTLDPQFQLETLFEAQTTQRAYTRISRVKL